MVGSFRWAVISHTMHRMYKTSAGGNTLLMMDWFVLNEILRTLGEKVYTLGSTPLARNRMCGYWSDST